MSKGKNLKGIAYGLLGKFVSRNNDIEGYWGLGVLRSFAEKCDLSRVAIVLLDPEPSLTSQPPYQQIKNDYKDWLYKVLARTGVRNESVKQAEISVQFGSFDDMPNAIRDTRGDPYICTVTITDDSGRTFRASRSGCCAPHDPNSESRSTRVL